MLTYTLIVTEANGNDTTYTTRSLNKAYALYDKAVEMEMVIVAFRADDKRDGYTNDMRDYSREPEAITWNAAA